VYIPGRIARLPPPLPPGPWGPRYRYVPLFPPLAWLWALWQTSGLWPLAARARPALRPPPKPMGPPNKNKSVTSVVVVGGWVRGQKRTRVRFIFWIFFYRVFELPSPRNAQNT
jgi:hypothetical protein